MNRAVPNTPDPSQVPAASDTLAFHRALPGYEPTPLVRAGELAAELGLGPTGDVFIKDESSRFGLPAFKFLGASWAIAQLLGGSSDLDELRASAADQGIERLTTATDGNHGRAVARMARMLGLSSTIYVPAFTAQARRDAIAGEGADVVVVDDEYDAAVETSIRDADADPGARAVNDADLTGITPVGEWVIQGYGTLFAEVAEQLAAAQADVDLVVLQMGVGAFASSGIRWAASRGIPAVGAEPAGAACVAASIEAGEPVTIHGSRTTMACLDAGTPTAAGWTTLLHGLSGVVVLDDPESDAAARRLARLGIESGESGAAGTAGLIALATEPACAGLREQIGFASVRSALVVSTEGATDPERYRSVVLPGG
jgi:diaminopropionate ammonia-lyase